MYMFKYNCTYAYLPTSPPTHTHSHLALEYDFIFVKIHMYRGST